MNSRRTGKVYFHLDSRRPSHWKEMLYNLLAFKLVVRKRISWMFFFSFLVAALPGKESYLALSAQSRVFHGTTFRAICMYMGGERSRPQAQRVRALEDVTQASVYRGVYFRFWEAYAPLIQLKTKDTNTLEYMDLLSR